MTARDTAAGGVVVVGVDGSPGSSAALDFALREAARRGDRLRVVVAVESPEPWIAAYGHLLRPPPPDPLGEAARAGWGWVRDAAVRLRGSAHTGAHAGAEVEVHAAHGAPAHVLLSAARDAALLVVGHRGRGAVASVLLGSVGLRCVLDAPCPVTVVRPAPVTEPVAAPMALTPVPVPTGG